ncbi:hypothetical protein CENSYa_2034 [Cenarchaeum symbiosum A]|uniref:Uncharacterized protein n=1 Tax=Cenarchaeum symbiosum (strain A) TaxID=414004 RepID=A0RZ70_CENSY|nr:hypothetical protein CENSYa_2034 [Cenarchaeum symbiosum A]
MHQGLSLPRGARSDGLCKGCAPRRSSLFQPGLPVIFAILHGSSPLRGFIKFMHYSIAGMPHTWAFPVNPAFVVKARQKISGICHAVPTRTRYYGSGFSSTVHICRLDRI